MYFNLASKDVLLQAESEHLVMLHGVTGRTPLLHRGEVGS